MLKAIFNVRSAVRCLAVAALVFAAPGARAQDALVPLPSVLDFTRGGGFGLALGGSFEYSPAYEGANQYNRNWSASGVVQWRRGNHMLFWESRDNLKDHELGWRGKLGKRFLAQVSAIRVKGRGARDSEDGFLDALDARDDEYAGAVELRVDMANDWKNWIGGRVQTDQDEYGTLGALSFGHRIMGGGDGTGIETILYATFADGDHLNRNFGVSADEADQSLAMVADPMDALPETDIGGGYRSLGAKFIFRRDISQRLHVILEGGAEVYRGDISNSRVTREDRDFTGGATVLYRF